MTSDTSPDESSTADHIATAALWLRGGVSVAGDVYRGTVGIVEGVHRAVSDRTRPINPAAPLEQPIRSLVYREVRDIGALSFAAARFGAGLSSRVAPYSADARPTGIALGVQSALNGVCGDYLAASNNELALTMRFVDAAGDVVDVADANRLAACAGTSSHLVLLIHGLGMNDRQWRQGNAPDMGERLAAECGGASLRLRYNTGLAIADNGRELADQLARLADSWPGGLGCLTVVGHSMGGLVARAALEHARAVDLVWRHRLDAIVCLGSPHRGAPLERLGDRLNRGLGWSEFSRPFTAIGNVRSAGVKDLRHGVDWPEAAVDDAAAGPGYLLIAATLGGADDDCIGRSLGDLLVTVDSAADRRAAGSQRAGAVEVRIFHHRHHFDLLGDAEVYDAVSDWLADRRSCPGPASQAESSTDSTPI